MTAYWRYWKRARQRGCSGQAVARLSVHASPHLAGVPVSDATYRIEVEHFPGEGAPYYGRVYLLSDDTMPVQTFNGYDQQDVARQCQGWLAAQQLKRDTLVFWT